jgi:formiminotetrahydrofolate cyclodeaminase
VGVSLWAARTEDLLSRTSSASPTPGGGAISAVVGAFGVGLLQMAAAISQRSEPLEDLQARLSALQAQIVPAADQDARDFSSLMAAYRQPADDESTRRSRDESVEVASITATEGPLSLVANLVEALTLSRELEPLVKTSVLSDVFAGRDIVRGAARAAIHTVDINLNQLIRQESPSASRLRSRRDEFVLAVERAV